MASLKQISTGKTLLLEPHYVVGRGFTCNLRLSPVRSLALHAEIRWTQHRWELRDLASRNGTFLNGERLKAGEEYAAQEGARLAFGSLDEEWEFVDASPPPVMATPLDGGEPVILEGEFLALPSAENPVVTIYERKLSAGLGEAGWFVETPGHAALPIANQHVFECAGRSWRFSCPPPGTQRFSYDTRDSAPQVAPRIHRLPRRRARPRSTPLGCSHDRSRDAGAQLLARDACAQTSRGPGGWSRGGDVRLGGSRRCGPRPAHVRPAAQHRRVPHSKAARRRGRARRRRHHRAPPHEPAAPYRGREAHRRARVISSRAPEARGVSAALGSARHARDTRRTPEARAMLGGAHAHPPPRRQRPAIACNRLGGTRFLRCAERELPSRGLYRAPDRLMSTFVEPNTYELSDFPRQCPRRVLPLQHGAPRQRARPPRDVPRQVDFEGVSRRCRAHRADAHRAAGDGDDPANARIPARLRSRSSCRG